MENIREIPGGWEKVELTDYIKFQKSGLSRAIVSQDIGIPVIISGNIQNGKLCTNELKYWYREDPQGSQVENYILKENDILLCFINSVDQIGKVCIFKDFNREAIYTTNLFRIEPNKRVNHEYLYFTLSSNYIQSEIKKIVKPAVNQASFTKADFQKIQLIAPKSIIEQQKISKILSTIDQNIEKTEQTIEKYIKIKNGLMDDLLTGKRRFKDGKWVVETEFKDVEGVGKVPKDWDVKLLKEIAKICYGKDQKSVQDDTNGIYPILGTGGQIGKSIQYLYNKPSVLIGRKGTIDKPRYIEKPFWTVDTLYYTEVYDDYVPKWLYYALNLINLNIYNEATGVPSLNGKTIYKIRFLVPSKDEQEHIVKIITKQDHLIEKEQQYLQKLKSLKSGLMEDLLTGKVRVK